MINLCRVEKITYGTAQNTIDEIISGSAMLTSIRISGKLLENNDRYARLKSPFMQKVSAERARYDLKPLPNERSAIIHRIYPHKKEKII